MFFNLKLYTPSTSKQYVDSGLQRCQVICIVEDVPESNQNLQLLLNTLQLDEVEDSLACDLKCANAVFGVSTHIGKYACLWCEGEKLLEGEER